MIRRWLSPLIAKVPVSARMRKYSDGRKDSIHKIGNRVALPGLDREYQKTADARGSVYDYLSKYAIVAK